MSERRALWAIVVLFLIGFGLLGLASSVNSTWPLFVSVIPYALIPWLVIHRDVSPVPTLDEG
ncbi:MAG: hypothetical protein WD670_00035 [Actinomycetota bacterium]